MNDPSDPRRGGTHASEAQPDALCPGRFLAQKSVLTSENGQDPSASRGTKIHAALAGKIESKTLALEERETFDRCREIEKNIVQQLFPPESPVIPLKVFREQRFFVNVPEVSNPTVGVYFHSGQPDVVYRRGPQALIIEYKTLAGDVPESPKNLQLRDQAVLIKGFLMVDEVAVVVNQPWVTMKPEICLYSPEDLKQAEIEMWDRVRKSNDPKSPRIPSEIACQYCRAKSVCQEYQQWAGTLTVAMSQVLGTPMASWTAEQRAFAADRLPAARDFLEELESFLKGGLEKDSNFVPGHHLKPGNIIEIINNPQECFTRFSALGGKLEGYMAAIKVLKTPLREQVHAVSGLKGKALDQAMDLLTKGIVDSKQNKPSLKKIEK